MLSSHSKKRHRNESGQAAVEMALALPFLIWLLFYMLNAFHTMHSSHIAQKYAAMSLWERIAYRSKFVVDDADNRFHGKEFMAVRFLDKDGRSLPARKIVVGPSRVNVVVGICREPGC